MTTIVSLKDQLQSLFAADLRVSEIQKNIAKNQQILSDIHNNMDEIEILEEEVEINGEEMVLFSAPGSDGVAVAKADIDSGAITRKQAYETVIPTNIWAARQ